MSPQAHPPRVLVVDDEPGLVRAYARALRAEAMEVETATDLAEALVLLDARPFDVVLSDVSMPEGDGLELLREVRRRDLDLPVILVTGLPSVASALGASAAGAYRYLVKPVPPPELAQAVREACQVHYLAAVRRTALTELGALERPIGDQIGLLARFDAALERLYMVYQPVVRWPTREVYGYEALLRSDEASLAHPLALLDAADRLARGHELGRAIRAQAPRPLTLEHGLPLLFCNLQLDDLLDPTLFESAGPLGRVAHRVVFEVTERAALDRLTDVRARAERLRAMGFRIALDDVGAGYAGLNAFALLEPDLVKIDRELVREVQCSATKRRLVRALVEVGADLGIEIIAEGVETVEERDALSDLGCSLMQGYLFAKPAREPAPPQW